MTQYIIVFSSSFYFNLISLLCPIQAPLSVDLLGGTSYHTSDFSEPQTNLKTAELVVNGAVVETKLFIYGKVGRLK